MKLTLENAAKIALGDVVKFTWTTTEGEKQTDVGVVYGNDALGIKCNCEDSHRFGYGHAMFTGDIDFEILTDHAPVALYGMEYDFVSKHQ